MTIADTYPDSKEWPSVSVEASYEQGWGIFDSDGSDNGRTQLCRWDQLEKFPSDDEAWQFVVTQAKAGDALCRRALDVVRRHNPTEFVAIVATCGAVD